MPFSYQTFYHSNSKLLVRYSRHGLNNRSFEEPTFWDHLNTKLVCYSDPHCNYTWRGLVVHDREKWKSYRRVKRHQLNKLLTTWNKILSVNILRSFWISEFCERLDFPKFWNFGLCKFEPTIFIFLVLFERVEIWILSFLNGQGKAFLIFKMRNSLLPA